MREKAADAATAKEALPKLVGALCAGMAEAEAARKVWEHVGASKDKKAATLIPTLSLTLILFLNLTLALTRTLTLTRTLRVRARTRRRSVDRERCTMHAYP